MVKPPYKEYLEQSLNIAKLENELKVDREYLKLSFKNGFMLIEDAYRGKSAFTILQSKDLCDELIKIFYCRKADDWLIGDQYSEESKKT